MLLKERKTAMLRKIKDWFEDLNYYVRDKASQLKWWVKSRINRR